MTGRTVNCNKAENSTRASAARKRGRSLALKLIAIIVAAGALALFAAALISTAKNGTITAAYYSVKSPKITSESGLRIVLLSDLHRTKFDETNQQLIDRVEEQQPDLICVGGDMLEKNCSDEEVGQLVSLFERLTAIAPVYFSAGNHDYTVYYNTVHDVALEYVSGENESEALQRLESTGAVFLENDYLDIELCGQTMRIGGFYAKSYRTRFDTDESWEPRRRFLDEYCDTDAFKLMLSHRPESFEPEKSEADPDIDLILSGHTHGGVVCLPFGLGAIWTSDGFFPKYDKGEFDIGAAEMIVTSGLSGYGKIPRVFNPPEIAVIDLLPDSDQN